MFAAGVQHAATPPPCSLCLPLSPSCLCLTTSLCLSLSLSITTVQGDDDCEHVILSLSLFPSLCDGVRGGCQYELGALCPTQLLSWWSFTPLVKKALYQTCSEVSLVFSVTALKEFRCSLFFIYKQIYKQVFYTSKFLFS